MVGCRLVQELWVVSPSASGNRRHGNDFETFVDSTYILSMLKMKRNSEMEKYILPKRRKISYWLLAPECCKRLNLRVAMRLRPLANGIFLERPSLSPDIGADRPS